MPILPCSVKALPGPEAAAAARTARDVNPANAPARAAAGLVGPGRLSLLTTRYWGAGGVRLGVQFLDAADPALKARILSHMNAWAPRANVRFAESRSGEVRLTRTPGQGYWSYLGTDVLHVPAGQATMNLEGFSLSTPEGEYRRVVRHETGHTLGFPHEHLRAAIISRLDREKAVAYFMRTQGWSRDEVVAQVLTPLAEGDLTALPADVLSIMCYALPGEVTADGRDIPGGEDIDPEDYRLAGTLYPPAGTTPTPTPTPTPPDRRRPLFRLNFPARWPRGQVVPFAAPVDIPAGAYDVVPL